MFSRSTPLLLAAGLALATAAPGARLFDPNGHGVDPDGNAGPEIRLQNGHGVDPDGNPGPVVRLQNGHGVDPDG
jgi:hypothetical protein